MQVDKYYQHDSVKCPKSCTLSIQHSLFSVRVSDSMAYHIVYQPLVTRVKGEVCHSHKQCRPGAHLPSIGGQTTEVCDAWPVRRQTCGYLPSRRASPSLDWYQSILLGDRGTCVNNLPKVIT